MRSLVLLAAVALAASACAPKTFAMEGKDAEQMSKDEAQCRAQVRQQAQQERNIEDQRRSTFDGERERFGQQDLYRTMDNQGYKNNVDRMTARCMEARGWAPKNQNSVSTWWNRVSTFNTPQVARSADLQVRSLPGARHWSGALPAKTERAGGPRSQIRTRV